MPVNRRAVKNLPCAGVRGEHLFQFRSQLLIAGAFAVQYVQALVRQNSHDTLKKIPNPAQLRNGHIGLLVVL